MFKNLTDFSYRRNWKEAVGFYIAYLILVILAAIVASLLIPSDASNYEEGFNHGVKVGTYVAALCSLIIPFIILKKKNLLSNFPLILLALVSGICGYLGGGIFGLIIPAFLT